MKNVRPATGNDADGVKTIVMETGMFSDDEIAFMDDMVHVDLDDGGAERLWLVAEDGEGALTGAACLSTETLQPDVSNLLFLGVRPSSRRAGTATRLIDHVEQECRQRGDRLLLIETASDAAFAPARSLYSGLGYTVDGRIVGYYAPDTDKVIFRKSL